VADLPLQHPAGGPHQRRIMRRQAQRLDAGDDRRQRVAQLVRQDRQELVLAPVGVDECLFGPLALLEEVADDVLPAAAGDGGAQRADQRDLRHRPLQEADVVAGFQPPQLSGVARAASERARQDDDRDRRPRRFRRDPVVPLAAVLQRQSLVGDQHRAGAQLQLSLRMPQVRADRVFQTRRGKCPGGKGGIPARGRQDQDSLLVRACVARRDRERPRHHPRPSAAPTL